MKARRSALAWVGGILGLGAPSFTFFAGYTPPLFPHIWIVLTVVSAILLYVVVTGAVPANRQSAHPKSVDQQAIRRIMVALACMAIYVLMLESWTVTDPRQQSRFQIGFGTAEWSLNQHGQQLIRKLPNASAEDLMLAEAAYHPGGPQKIWAFWTIVTAGSILITLHGLAVGFWTAGCGLLVRRQTRADTAPASARSPRRVMTVFISYNHADGAAAIKVRDLLRKHEVEVIVDNDSMLPGESIDDFIVRSLRDADIVIVILSSHSLVSGWVAAETMKRLDQQQWDREKLLIGACLDRDMFRPDFRLVATERINARIQEIESLMPRYAKERLDPADLNDERTRLYNLRNDLGTILAKLRGSRIIDLHDATSEDLLVRAVTGTRETP